MVKRAQAGIYISYCLFGSLSCWLHVLLLACLLLQVAVYWHFLLDSVHCKIDRGNSLVVAEVAGLYVCACQEKHWKME